MKYRKHPRWLVRNPSVHWHCRTFGGFTYKDI